MPMISGQPKDEVFGPSQSFFYYSAFGFGWQDSRVPKLIQLQLNLHETDLLFRYLSHHVTWHCLLIYVFPTFLLRKFVMEEWLSVSSS